MWGTGFSCDSRICLWAPVQRKAVVQFVILASGLWEQRDFNYGECAGEGSTAFKKKKKTVQSLCVTVKYSEKYVLFMQYAS